MIKIGKDCIVSIRYVMKNSVGEVLENTMHSQPVSYLQGTDGILQVLQQQLEGLCPGEKKEICLEAGEGTLSEDFSFEVIIDDVRVALHEEILLGYPVQAVVEPCEADCYCYKHGA